MAPAASCAKAKAITERDMQAFICTTCGTQYPPADKPPPNCPICDDERQYGDDGQRDEVALRRDAAWLERVQVATECKRGDGGDDGDG